MGTIKKVPIGEVIKDDDQGNSTNKNLKIHFYILVFLGHKIPEMSRSVNIRERVAKRARACCASPSLIFDYNQKDNCEAFANLMSGAADQEAGKLGAQEDNTHWFVASLCCLIGCFKCKRRRLEDVVRTRLKEAKDGELE